VPLETGGMLRVELNHISFEKMEKHFDVMKNDNRILAVALNLQEEEKEKENDQKEVVLVTNDILNGVKGDTLGVRVEKYENDRLVDNLESVHTGFHTAYVPVEYIDEFYKNEYLELSKLKEYIDLDNVYQQDFFILKDENGSSSSGLGRVVHSNGKLRLVTLVMGKEEEVWGVKPKNVQQRMFLELLMDPNVSLVCGLGQAGTGKTLLALAAALTQTEEEHEYKKILAARPVIAMGKDIGYLPGEKNEKLRPWMQPIYDNLEFLFDIDEDSNDKNGQKTTIETIVDGLNLEIEALTYIRGRSIPRQFMIIDEAQNLSKHEVKTIISRVGEGTKIVLLGDPEQIDHPYLDATNNGLTYTVEKMKQEPDVGIVRLAKTERSTLAEKAAKLL
jgi:PhoH-like ATPase